MWMCQNRCDGCRSERRAKCGCVRTDVMGVGQRGEQSVDVSEPM